VLLKQIPCSDSTVSTSCPALSVCSQVSDPSCPCFVLAGSLLSIDEAVEQSEDATVHFFCPDTRQATAVEQAIRGATGVDLFVSLSHLFCNLSNAHVDCTAMPKMTCFPSKLFACSSAGYCLFAQSSE